MGAGESMSQFMKFVSSLLMFAMTLGVHGQTGEEKFSLGEATLTQEELQLKSSITHLDVTHSTYVSSDELFFRSRNASETISTIGISLEDKISLRDPCSSAVKGTAFYSLDESRAYINPIWAYFGCSVGQSVFEVGRVPHNWSFSDRFWKQGYINPRFMWDRSRPEVQGLTGVFAHRKVGPKIQVTGFVSPIFVPDLGASVDEQDGRVVSDNPWFRPPPQQLELFGQVLPVRATVNAPDAKDIVSHGAVGAQLRWQEGDVEVLGGILYKPMNQLLMSTPVRLVNSSEVEIEITPRVHYHTVSWIETGWDRWGVDKGHFSLTFDEPDRVEERQGWIYQDVKSATNLSLYYGRDLKGQGRDATHVYGSYYRLIGGVSKDIGEFASSASYFESRYILRNAIRLGIHQPLYGRFLGKRWESDLSVTYDLTLGGAMLTSQVDLEWSRFLDLSIVADFFGLVSDDGKDEISNFFANYRSNDKIQLRMSYVY